MRALETPVATMRSPNRIIWIIVAGLLAWGAYLAVGTYFGHGDIRHDFRRSAFILVAVGGFVAMWAAALYFRARRINRGRR